MNLGQRVLLFVVLATPLLNIGLDIYTPSLPAVASYFGATHFAVKFSLVIYAIAFGLAQPLLGPVTDYFGRRYFILASLLILCVSNVMALFADSIALLCVARMVQGVGGSMISVALKGLMVDCFEGRDLTKAMSYFSVGWSLTPIFAPLIGAYLEHTVGWRASFFVIAVYAVMALLLLLFFIPETAVKSSRRFLEWLGLYKTISCDGLFLSSVWILAVQFAILLIFYLESPFLLQGALHISVLHYGQILFGLGLMYLAGNILNRLLLQRYDAMALSYVGLFVTFFMSVVMLIWALSTPLNLWQVLVPICLIFFVDGLVFPNVMALCLMFFKHYGGTAGGILGGALSLCAALISALAGAFKAETAMPLAAVYTVLVGIECWVFFAYFRHRVKKGAS